MRHITPLHKTSLGQLGVAFISLFLIAALCEPLDLFYRFVARQQQSPDYEATDEMERLGITDEPEVLQPGDEFDSTESSTYVGQFVINNLSGYSSVADNNLLLFYDPVHGTLGGTGSMVLVNAAEFDTDVANIETYLFQFDGKLDADNKTFNGNVHVTGGSECTNSCEGVDNYKLDFYASFTASLVEGGSIITGHMTDMGNFGDFKTAMR